MDAKPVPAARTAARALPTLAPLFEGDLELDAVERMLLELAVHPDGCSARRAWLVIWDARAGRMEGWRAAEAAADPAPLAESLGRARRAAPGEAERRVRAWAEAPEDLDGVLAEAWSGVAAACGAGAANAPAPWAGVERLGAVALRRGPRAYGLVVTAWSGAGSEEGVRARCEWLREVADVALGVQWRAATARLRARQASALEELARASVSALNVAEGEHLVARLAAEGLDALGAAFYRADAEGALATAVTFGPADVRDELAAGFAAAARGTADAVTALAGDSGAEAPGASPAAAVGASAWATAPVAAYGRTHGVLLVYDGPERHPASAGFDAGDVRFLATLADQAALLVEHARALDSARRAERRTAEQAVRLHELDRLSAVGDLAARVARESRNPIASIAAFARRAQAEAPEGDPQREYLEIVVRETERLEAMLREQMEYARLERGRLRMQNLNAVVQEALMAASESLVRRRVRLVKKLAADLPELLLDEQRIRRVVENVVAFALESVPAGGRIKIESRRAGEWVALDVAHDGLRAGGDLLEQLFVPFASAPAGGAAVGLGVAQQIVREHGGEVRVRSEGEWATVFSFTLPVKGNEDRRKGPDRRSVRADRRRGDENRAAG